MSCAHRQLGTEGGRRVRNCVVRNLYCGAIIAANCMGRNAELERAAVLYRVELVINTTGARC